ncbi:ferritin-like domain-containing protein [Streptomyces sp. NPDC058459]|uniref:ferritin-like domain-containing protein n=1 Tax=Streptomyces sp. NPDC058459 TaxID=3346508 RepID=UPI0036673E0B
MSVHDGTDRTKQSERAELTALQAALAAEHAAVYGYGVVGGRIGAPRQGEARAAYDAHRAARDTLARSVRDLGGEPVAASPAYALPFTVADSSAALRLAAELEERLAGVYADLVRDSAGHRRTAAASALREAAVRAVRWSGASPAFPGLAERTYDTTGRAGAPDSAPSASPAA